MTDTNDSSQDETAPRTRAQKFNEAARRLDLAAKAVGIALVLLIVGVFTFPLGIIAWIIGAFVLVGGVLRAISGEK